MERVMTRARLRRSLTDSAFLLGLSAVALLSLRTTYDGWTFLVVGVAGAALGIALVHTTVALRLPWYAVAPAVTFGYFLAGGPIALGEPPTPSAISTLADAAVHGWKQLLTTLPPVPGTGSLLALPLLMGLLGGAAGQLVAARTNLVALPALPPLLMFVVAILMGSTETTVPVLLGVVFAVAVLAWFAVRLSRRNRGSGGSRTRAVQAGALLVFASLVAFGGTALVGGDHSERVVLRDQITPPVDLSEYSSPLVGFRKYTKDANRLWDQTLFTVRGLPGGQRVRIAVLDSYDGLVWGAGQDAGGTPGAPRDSFQRVGVRVPTTAAGERATVSVRVETAYASAEDVNAWLPDTGSVTAVRFAGPAADGHTEWFRYNLATSSGLVADRLRAGDEYTVDVVLPDTTLPPDIQPYGPPTLDPSSFGFVAARATQWAGAEVGVGPRLMAVARYLRENGAYSSGGPNEGQFLPGHSVGRLTDFFNADRPVGDDEQYAAAFALVANSLGMPARVVFGATPEADGVVRGQDVHAWVEVHLADGRWATTPTAEFMPDTTKKPDQTPPKDKDNTDATVVPPPNMMRTPDSQEDLGSNRRGTGSPGTPGSDGWPWMVVLLLTYVAPPVSSVAAVCAAVLGIKALRRHRRRTVGTVVARIGAGWQEIVDRARDLGVRVPTGGTRKDDVRCLGPHGGQAAGRLAYEVDLVVFGAGDPQNRMAADFWARVDDVRRSMGSGLSRRRRITAALSLRSFLPARRAVTG
jgi:hypothetical protein